MTSFAFAEPRLGNRFRVSASLGKVGVADATAVSSILSTAWECDLKGIFSGECEPPVVFPNKSSPRIKPAISRKFFIPTRLAALHSFKNRTKQIPIPKDV